MRTTFFEMHLFNDTSFINSQSFIWNGKECGEGKRERERERKRKRDRDRGWHRKDCGMGHKLDHWSSIK